MRKRDNYFEEIERAAGAALAAVGYSGGGAVSERNLTDLAAYFGFSIARVQDLPPSTRSITDVRRRVVYVPQRNATGGMRSSRSVIAQTLGHFALGHHEPVDFEGYVRQRVEANYFAGALLAPERSVVRVIDEAKAREDISVEDLSEMFYISYEMAAHRLTNLATRHLGLRVHFLRADEEGVIWKAYENDGVPFPTDEAGIIEGQRVCRKWGSRQAFRSYDKFAEYAQYTATPAGEFWCTTHIETDTHPNEAVTIGARAADARYFRGHQTTHRGESGCPDPACCRRPPADIAARWQGRVWPAARVHGYVLATLPAGAFAGVDLNEVYDFLDRQGA
jgi:predicted transcriptional regulator